MSIQESEKEKLNDSLLIFKGGIIIFKIPYILKMRKKAKIFVERIRAAVGGALSS